MLELFGGADADFLAQVEDVLLQQPVNDGGGEATAAAAASAERGCSQLPTSSSGNSMRGPSLVGPTATELEPSQGQHRGCMMEDSLSGLEDTLHLASLHKTIDDKLQVVPDPLKDHMYFSFPITPYEEVVASSPLLSSPLNSILNPSSQSPITSHIPSLPSRARRRSASSFSTVSAASAPDSAYDSCLESSNDKKCESSMSDDSNVSCNDSFADSFFNFPTTDSTLLSPSHKSSTNDLTMARNTASSEIRDTDDCQLSTIKDDRRPSTESTESLTTTLDLDLLNSLLTKDILNDMGQVIFNDVEGRGEENYPEVNGSLDDNSAELLNAFDSCDWEETFREFFPELACT